MAAPLPWSPARALDRGALLLAALQVVGLGLAGYLTAVHYANVPLVCSASGAVNCELVTTSVYSVVPGTALPITVPGMLFFLASLTLAGLQLRGPATLRVRRLHAALAGAGMLAALDLIFDEFVRLHTICLWCTGVHVVILATLLTTVWRLSPARGEPEPAPHPPARP